MLINFMENHDPWKMHLHGNSNSMKILIPWKILIHFPDEFTFRNNPWIHSFIYIWWSQVVGCLGLWTSEYDSQGSNLSVAVKGRSPCINLLREYIHSFFSRKKKSESCIRFPYTLFAPLLLFANVLLIQPQDCCAGLQNALEVTDNILGRLP